MSQSPLTIDPEGSFLPPLDSDEEFDVFSFKYCIDEKDCIIDLTGTEDEINEGNDDVLSVGSLSSVTEEEGYEPIYMDFHIPQEWTMITKFIVTNVERRHPTSKRRISVPGYRPLW